VTGIQGNSFERPNLLRLNNFLGGKVRFCEYFESVSDFLIAGKSRNSGFDLGKRIQTVEQAFVQESGCGGMS
jgi:hypothetical protein